jgi:hypothetical protein
MRKADLPTRICQSCGRPFSWRKKWAKVWDEVRYCSNRCRQNRKKPHSHLPNRSSDHAPN